MVTKIVKIYRDFVPLLERKFNIKIAGGAAKKESCRSLSTVLTHTIDQSVLVSRVEKLESTCDKLFKLVNNLRILIILLLIIIILLIFGILIIVIFISGGFNNADTVMMGIDMHGVFEPLRDLF